MNKVEKKELIKMVKELERLKYHVMQEINNSIFKLEKILREG